MTTPIRLFLALSLCIVVACDKGDDTGGESSAESSGTTTETETETGGEPILCGELECAANQACLTFPQSPMCTEMNEGEPCPVGTTETACGGAGFPCCCEPPPPTVYECVDPVCEGPVDCACLVDVCIPECTPSVTPGVFFCEEPPAP
jgi:hypothetical protein